MTNILIPSKEHRQLNFLLLKIYHYCSLLKPRVMYLAIFTSLVGMLIAPGQLSLLDSFL
ncbi:uncharacterized protein METZ01_LOCUS481431, partial [marine metagenome]